MKQLLQGTNLKIKANKEPFSNQQQRNSNKWNIGKERSIIIVMNIKTGVVIKRKTVRKNKRDYRTRSTTIRIMNIW